MVTQVSAPMAICLVFAGLILAGCAIDRAIQTYKNAPASHERPGAWPTTRGPQ